MNDCGWLSDRMPAVALGRAEWTEEETRHLSGCPSCQGEWELVRLSSHLGQEVAAKLEAGSTTRAVFQRLERARQEERLRHHSWTFAALAIAAAIAAVVWTGRPITRPVAASAGPVVAASLLIPLPELDNLDQAELNTVLQTIDEPMVGGPTDTSGSAALDDDDLEGVLNIWEG
jgi:hypothetical protein